MVSLKSRSKKSELYFLTCWTKFLNFAEKLAHTIVDPVTYPFWTYHLSYSSTIVIVSPALLLRLSPVSQGFLYMLILHPSPPPTLTLTPRHTPSLGKQELKKEVALIPPAYIERYSKQILQYSLSSGTRKSRKVVVKFHMLSGSYHTVSVDDVLLTRVQSFNFDKTF